VQRIFVGDVQGCASELDGLIERARAAYGGEYELWLVGDLVNRGPASLRALEQARALADAGRARVVLGNHEISLLRVAAGQRELARDDTFRDVLEAGGDWIDWLRALPLVAIDRVGGQRFAMLHAASAPGWSLDELAARARRVEERLAASRADAGHLLDTDPRDGADADVLARLTRCRSVDASGRWSSREPKRTRDAWHRRWRDARPDFGIVYGHWATQGLHVEPLLRGLDTGCVYNGAWGERALTAWLPAHDAARPFDVPDARFWSVPARARYVRIDGEESA
jgi:bis(5'-nucleosyl)-tetraphosphatase (symmetrical)